MFVPADLEPAKIEHALAYGATVVPIDGTYDDVNRLCLEVADELGWGLVNVNLRPFYAEGSKTLALRDRRGPRLAAARRHRRADRVGRDAHPLARAFEELVELGWVEREAGPVRRRTGRRAARRSRPRAPAAATLAPVRTPDTIVRSLAIGNPADGLYALELAPATRRVDRGDRRRDTAEAIRRAARLEGIYTETAGGVTIAAVEAARRRGVIRDGDEVVALLTGNGLKTPDAVRLRHRDADARRVRAGPASRPCSPRASAPSKTGCPA